MNQIIFLVLFAVGNLWAGGGPPGAGGGWYREIKKGRRDQWIKVTENNLKLVDGKFLTLETFASGSGALGYPAILKSKTPVDQARLESLLALSKNQYNTIAATITTDHYEFLRFPPYSSGCIRNIAHDIVVEFDGLEFTLPTEWIAMETMTREECTQLAKSVKGFRYI
jgi:hypothetical protein